MKWATFDGNSLKFSLKQTIEDALNAEISENEKPKICIGTDSQVKGIITEFATAIVFLRKGRGGFMFVGKDKIISKLTIKERMMKEVNTSIEVAYSLNDLFETYHIQPEIHVDINVNASFKSNVALQDAMGYIKGMGYGFRAKPEAFASTNCADRVI